MRDFVFEHSYQRAGSRAAPSCPDCGLKAGFSPHAEQCISDEARRLGQGAFAVTLDFNARVDRLCGQKGREVHAA